MREVGNLRITASDGDPRVAALGPPRELNALEDEMISLKGGLPLLLLLLLLPPPPPRLKRPPPPRVLFSASISWPATSAFRAVKAPIRDIPASDPFCSPRSSKSISLPSAGGFASAAAAAGTGAATPSPPPAAASIIIKIFYAKIYFSMT